MIYLVSNISYRSNCQEKLNYLREWPVQSQAAGLVSGLLLTRKFHESLAATTDMAVLPGVLGCRPLRRTTLVRLGVNTLWLPGGTPIFFALAVLRSVPQAGSQFRGLATGIHEISGLRGWVLLQNKKRLLDLVNREPSLRWSNGVVEH